MGLTQHEAKWPKTKSLFLFKSLLLDELHLELELQHFLREWWKSMLHLV